MPMSDSCDTECTYGNMAENEFICVRVKILYLEANMASTLNCCHMVVLVVRSVKIFLFVCFSYWPNPNYCPG